MSDAHRAAVEATIWSLEARVEGLNALIGIHVGQDWLVLDRAVTLHEITMLKLRLGKQKRIQSA